MLKKLFLSVLIVHFFGGWVLCTGDIVFPEWNIDYETDSVGSPPAAGDYVSGIICTYVQHYDTAANIGYSVTDGYTDTITGNTMNGKCVVVENLSTIIQSFGLYDGTMADIITLGRCKVSWEQLNDSNSRGVLTSLRTELGDEIFVVLYDQSNGPTGTVTVYARLFSSPGVMDSQVNAGTFPKGTVLNSEIIADLDARTADFYVKDQYLGTYGLPGSGALGAIWFSGYGSTFGATSTAAYDNIVVERAEAGDPPGPADTQSEEVITSSQHVFNISVGGTMDIDNTTTVGVNGLENDFDGMNSVTIENTGDVTVTGIRVVANGRGNWYTLEDLYAEATAGAQNDQEKLYMLSQFLDNNTWWSYFWFVKQAPAECRDPVKHLNSYGSMLCGGTSSVWCSLLNRDVNFSGEARLVALNGHVVAAADYGDGYHIMDVGGKRFSLNTKNNAIASPTEVATDHDLLKREPVGDKWNLDWSKSQSSAALYGDEDYLSESYSFGGHEIDITLRPGEKLVWLWENRGKYATDGYYGQGTINSNLSNPSWSNSLFEYTPRLTIAEYQQGVHSSLDIIGPTSQSGSLAGSSANAYLIYRIDSPYTICGGLIEAEFEGLEGGDVFEIYVSPDNSNWTNAWAGGGTGQHLANITIDDVLEVHSSAAKYHYYVGIWISSASSAHGANLCSLKMTTDVMNNPWALPRLKIGQNSIVYSDETAGAHEVTVTYDWNENSAFDPPEIVETGNWYPADGANVDDSLIAFTWPEAVGGAEYYHLQVSKYPDFRILYRTSFDHYHSDNYFTHPWLGIFSPGQIYYWRVRAKISGGPWCNWSNARQFTWNGPAVPENLQYAVNGSEITISWQDGSVGNPAVKYEVYASDEKGFTPSKVPYGTYGLGTVAANYVGETTSNSMLVVGPEAVSPNKAYYRIVAVDSSGTQGGASDMIEVQRPFIYSEPPIRAAIDLLYGYQSGCIKSIGDLQYRDGNYTYCREEVYDWAKTIGPAWLSVDSGTGMLGGMPGIGDLGSWQVQIRATTTWPYDSGSGNGPIEYQTYWLDVLEEFCGDANHSYPDGDHDEDCYVSMSDLQEIAQRWLTTFSLTEFAVLAENWLDCTAPGGCE